MIDLHIHVLPGIDDGAGSWQESIAMCRQAADDGCTALVATPHQRRAWPNENPDEIARLVAELQERVGPEPTLYPGGEIHVDSTLLEELESDARGGLCPLATGRHLLLEFGPQQPLMGAAELVHELAVTEWIPIVAHPEFIPFLSGDLELLEELVSLGARLQITAMSLTGRFGDRVRADVFEMLEAGLVHFIASDAHSPGWRPPGLSEARQVVAHRWGEDLARRLTEENPRAVLPHGDVAAEALATP